MTDARSVRSSVGLLLLSTVPSAWAHSDLRDGGVVAGFLHPILGWDHLACMVLIGTLSTYPPRRYLWLVPALFAAMAALGTFVGHRVGAPHWTESAVQASALCLLAVGGIGRLRAPLLPPLAAAFGLLHGMAHGVELRGAAQPLAYAAGFITATVSLHLIGIAAAEWPTSPCKRMVDGRAI